MPAAIFAAVVTALYLLSGGPSNTVVIAGIAASTAWLWIERRRVGVRVDPVILCLLAVVAGRGMLPPYGGDGFSLKVASNLTLLFGLAVLTAAAVARTSISTLLWVIATPAAVCALLSIALHDFAISPRLEFIGHIGSPIFGTGGVVAGMVAALLLLGHQDNRSSPWRLALLLTAVTVDVVAIYLAGSRGPLLALAGAALSIAAWHRNRSRRVLAAGMALTWGAVSAAVLFDAPLRNALCSAIALACREANRSAAWDQSLQIIAASPWLGAGSEYRFPGPVFVHPHNGLTGVAMLYGLPILGVFIALLARASWNVSRVEDRDLQTFAAAMLVFSAGFMGSDLSDPFRFVSAHYLFFWIPLFAASTRRREV